MSEQAEAMKSHETSTIPHTVDAMLQENLLKDVVDIDAELKDELLAIHQRYEDALTAMDERYEVEMIGIDERYHIEMTEIQEKHKTESELVLAQLEKSVGVAAMGDDMFAATYSNARDGEESETEETSASLSRIHYKESLELSLLKVK